VFGFYVSVLFYFLCLILKLVLLLSDSRSYSEVCGYFVVGEGFVLSWIWVQWYNNCVVELNLRDIRYLHLIDYW